ncbi:MAG: UDP-N-acetylglucosamine--N-acetylmuramyl-(pentapeptide) pyrophosphoryl-undecaprenol [Actinomycetota bacterium]
MKSIALAAGGTAGHIQPALACARTMKKKDSNIDVFFIGTSKGLEQQLISNTGFELNLIPAVLMPRRFNIEIFSFPFKLIQSILITLKIFKEKNVGCVVGFGAYVSLPAYIAAFMKRIPIIVHEGNKKPGFANKVGALFAKEVFQMFPASIKKGKTIGMPIRQELKDYRKEILKVEAIKFFGLNEKYRTLFVFGGSQGARSINQAIEEVIPLLEGKNVQVIHSLGQKNEAKAELKKYSYYHPYPYIERMDLAYSVSDLVMSRAGAMTIAEQSFLGIPAIYIPFAVGNGEQILNVKEIIKADAGLLVLDSEISSQKLYDLIMNYIFDENKLMSMSQKAKNFGSMNADIEITNKVFEYIQIGNK